jgi:hypothetical protein
VIEKSNLWLMVTGDTGTGVTKNFKAYEFGLVSETFKLNSRTSQSVTRDTSAVSGSAAAEWRRNVGFTPRNTTGSGDKGAAVVYWTETAPPGISIRFKEYAGFTDTWSDPTLTTLERGWNWVGFNTGSKLYFILGSQPTLGANTPGNSPTNQRRHTVNLNNYTVSTTDFDTTNFKNGAEEGRGLLHELRAQHVAFREAELAVAPRPGDHLVGRVALGESSVRRPERLAPSLVARPLRVDELEVEEPVGVRGFPWNRLRLRRLAGRGTRRSCLLFVCVCVCV